MPPSGNLLPPPAIASRRARIVDFFAGCGGWTVAAAAIDAPVVFAANHWVPAVRSHQANHPTVEHRCQNVDLLDLTTLPQGFEVFLASPSCQGSSNARGKDRPGHDVERATAWIVPQVLLACAPRVVIVENVEEMRTNFGLYQNWFSTFKAAGYHAAEYVLDSADFGVPQHRERLFVVATRVGRTAPRVVSPGLAHVPVREILRWDEGEWSFVSQKAEATRARVAQAELDGHGQRFVMPYYGSGSGATGRSIDRPLGTLTTKDRWGLVQRDARGRRIMRMLSIAEAKAVMGFPPDYQLLGKTGRPASKAVGMRLLGNAVVPHVAAEVIAQALGASPGWALSKGWNLWPEELPRSRRAGEAA